MNMMKLGYVGLGKMGYNMALNLLEKGYEVIAHNRSPQKVENLVEEANAIGAFTLHELVEKLESPRVVWLMVPNDAVEDVTNELKELLEPGDIVIDGGNTFYKDTVQRAAEFQKLEISYMDVGVSGGPSGARNGASLMIGGNKPTFEYLKKLFKDLAIENGYAYLGKSGAGHFTKMVHNGIEYGMMQAIAEGFDVLRNSEFDLDLNEVLKPYRHGSVIESSLIDWLGEAYRKYGTDLDPISDKANQSGEGLWTIETAKEKGIKTEVIEKAVRFREESQNNPSYQAQIISALRGEFGEHPVFKK